MTNVHRLFEFARPRWPRPERGHQRPPFTLLGASAALACAAGALGMGALGCGGAEKTAATPATSGRPNEKIQHEACDLSGGHVEALDTNGDGRPDIHRVYDGSQHEMCRVVDLNRDGRTDLYEYFDGTGAIRRREFCYDDTGEVNAVEIYQGGKLVQRSYDTTGQHKIDTWDWFDPAAPVDAKTGRPSHPVRRERDVRGAGAIDQWWTWNGDQVTIATDRNGDGKPDPASTVVLGGGDDAGTAAPATATEPPDAGAMAPGPSGDGGTDGGAT